MFIGHFAPALAVAAHKDSPSLPVLFIGAQLVDWAFFGLVLAGVEKMRIVPGTTVLNPFDLFHMPYTHSLVGTVAWGAVFGLLISLMLKNRMAALLGFGVVVSHWFLDVLVHTQDMTIAGTPPKLGLGLWNHPAIEMPLELVISFGALWLYARATGGWRKSVLGLGAVLLALQATDWLGEKPTEVGFPMVALAWFGYAVATLAAWWASRDDVRRTA
jgi:hypothetical protein